MTLIRPHQRGRSAAQRHAPQSLYIIPLRYRRALPSGVGRHAAEFAKRSESLRADLTERNVAILEFVKAQDAPVSGREITAATGFGTHEVSNDLRKLQARDLVIRTGDGWRAVA